LGFDKEAFPSRKAVIMPGMDRETRWKAFLKRF
jgi:hypothetical protein